MYTNTLKVKRSPLSKITNKKVYNNYRLFVFLNKPTFFRGYSDHHNNVCYLL